MDTSLTKAEVGSQAVVVRLRQASKSISCAARRKFYETLVVTPKTELELAEIDAEPFLRRCSGPQIWLHFVKHVHVLAPIQYSLARRCRCRENADEGDNGSPGDGWGARAMDT